MTYYIVPVNYKHHPKPSSNYVPITTLFPIRKTRHWINDRWYSVSATNADARIRRRLRRKFKVWLVVCGYEPWHPAAVLPSSYEELYSDMFDHPWTVFYRSHSSRFGSHLPTVEMGFASAEDAMKFVLLSGEEVVTKFLN